MLATFWRKMVRRNLDLLSFLLGRCFFRYFGPTGPWGTPPWASILDGFWFHFGAKLALCWTIWAKELALDGLVGLREALKIFRAAKGACIQLGSGNEQVNLRDRPAVPPMAK